MSADFRLEMKAESDFLIVEFPLFAMDENKNGLLVSKQTVQKTGSSATP
ncbi:hypothetical protein [Hymenobacter canadensis]|uniref:Uncharacterized protein n=1 Tax=Hymenobacter canadensis TaxID=2999067 RepID=A0ABY7LPQ6_9BACT|nr:hypothetical protein [Hymenobacter canadensis]WBA42407.1 hypothetical protein O3303_02345 [Hymenobacter canadensis]